MENPYKFQLTSKSKTVHQALGYDITAIVDIGRALIEAKDNDDLPQSRLKAAAAAQRLINASAKAGIKGLRMRLLVIVQKFRLSLTSSKRLFVKRLVNMKRNFQMSYTRSGIDCTA